MPSSGPDNSALAAARLCEDRVWRLLERNEPEQALAACRSLNTEFPDYGPGWLTASRVALRFSKPEAALAAADRALSFAANNIDAVLQRAICLGRLGRTQDLASALEAVPADRLQTAWQHSALGLLYTQLERREEALACYRQAARLEPDRGKHYYNIAALERSLGEIDKAEANFDRAIDLDPDDFEAVRIRSELRTQTPARNHVEGLESMLAAGIDDRRGEVQVSYALAKELEDLGESRRSFEFLARGAQTRRRLMRYDVQRDVDTMAAIRETFSAELFSEARPRSDSGEPVFIVGMPRTGTTLVERILSSHSQVHSAGELGNFAALLMQQLRAEAPGVGRRDDLVRSSASLDFESLGNAYIESTRPFTGHTPRFIDKLPLNFLYVGLIHLALPKATIINLKRHPLDTCYAVFKQLFVDAYPFSYDLEELGRYYAAYQRLMDHWHSVLPGVVHTVSYEALVEDFEAEVRRLLDVCELPFEPACLRFHENRSASTTASTVQVRQPVYRTSVGRWRQYREQLAPLIATLEDEGIALPDGD